MPVRDRCRGRIVHVACQTLHSLLSVPDNYIMKVWSCGAVFVHSTHYVEPQRTSTQSVNLFFHFMPVLLQYNYNYLYSHRGSTLLSAPWLCTCKSHSVGCYLYDIIINHCHQVASALLRYCIYTMEVDQTRMLCLLCQITHLLQARGRYLLTRYMHMTTLHPWWGAVFSYIQL